MTARPLLIAALGAFTLCPAAAFAQINQPMPPSGATYAGEPPVAGPMQGGLSHEAWISECARRLNDTPGADPVTTPAACQSWWAYYQAGGAPDPTYGYAIPVNITQPEENCPEEVVETREVHHQIIRRAVPPRHHHDKRQLYFPD
jgi:hypothetical protein